MNDTKLFVGLKKFKILCINDYIYFFYSFYSNIFSEKPKAFDIIKKSFLDLANISISKKNNGKEKLIDNWFSLLEKHGIDPTKIFTEKLLKLLSNTSRRSELQILNNNNNQRNQEQINSYNINTLNLFANTYESKNNTNTDYEILVSPDKTKLFKKTKDTLKSKKIHSNECKVYNFLREISKLAKKQNEYNTRTCFIDCFKNGILLKNYGLSLFQMIERKEIPNIDWFNQLFSNIYVIHVAGVAHNDLDCKNIVGTGAFLINFGLSKIINVDIDENTESFLISINTFFYNFLIFYKDIIK